MGLIDPSILNRQPGSLLAAGMDGYNQGMQFVDARRQRGLLARQEQDRQSQMGREQGFRQNLGGLLNSFGEYAYTPQGQRELYTAMSQAGYGKEMAGLMGGMPGPMEQPKAAADSWDHVYGTDQIYNRKDGQFRSVPKPPPAAPTAETPAAWKGEKFVRSKNNTMVKVDASGRDKEGNQVELWTPPAKPKATPTPKPPSPVKALSGDAAKLLSISWTMQDDIAAMNKAFKDDFAGSIAGIKSGTNKRLLDLADQIADKVGRLRSGGAVNKDEEVRFMRLIATLRGAAFSNAQQAEETLNSLAREGSIVAEGIDPDGKHRERIRASQAPKVSTDEWTDADEARFQELSKKQGRP